MTVYDHTLDGPLRRALTERTYTSCVTLDGPRESPCEGDRGLALSPGVG